MTKIERLFLDDSRVPHEGHGFTVVKDFDEFVQHIIEHGVPKLVSFDYDLRDIAIMGKDERTGHDCAVFLAGYCTGLNVDLPRCYIHSLQCPGAHETMKYLNNFQRSRGMNPNVSWKNWMI